MGNGAIGQGFPSILEPGFHVLPIRELKRVCVVGFPLSKTRRKIFRNLIAVVQRLRASGVIGAVWIDGSFMTQKIDPEDVDVVLRLEAITYNNGSQAIKDAVNWFAGNLKAAHGCDSYHFFVFPVGHPNHAFGQQMHSYWRGQFGFDRDDKPKGVAVIELT